MSPHADAPARDVDGGSDEQQARSTVYEVRSSGMPARSWTCLAIERSLPGKLTPIDHLVDPVGADAGSPESGGHGVGAELGKVSVRRAPPNFPNGDLA